MEDIIKIAYKRLAKQSKEYRMAHDYYVGDHPVRYATEAMRDIFRRVETKFVMNWVGVVVNASLERLVFKGWDSESKDKNNTLDELYRELKIEILSERIHRDVLISKNGFVIFDKISGVIKPYYNSPNQVYVEYSEEDEDVVEFAVKVWVDEEFEHLHVYYPNRIETYRKKKSKTLSVDGFEQLEDKENPFGKIPVVHFKMEYDELTGILPLQDAINMMFSNMMVNSEFSTFPQRYIITNAEVDSVVSEAGHLLKIPASVTGEEQTKLGQFEPMGLDIHLSAIDSLANELMIISRTPKHYLTQSLANLAAETVQIMEAPLVKKVTQYQELLNAQWLEFASYFVDGTDDVVCVWDPPEFQNTSLLAAAAKGMIDIGIPLLTVLKRQGWGEAEIQQLMSDIEEEKKFNADTAATALQLAQYRFESQNG